MSCALTTSPAVLTSLLALPIHRIKELCSYLQVLLLLPQLPRLVVLRPTAYLFRCNLSTRRPKSSQLVELTRVRRLISVVRFRLCIHHCLGWTPADHEHLLSVIVKDALRRVRWGYKLNAMAAICTILATAIFIFPKIAKIVSRLLKL